jgi:hypothetical protein
MEENDKPRGMRELLFPAEYIKRMENFDRDIEQLNEKYGKDLKEGDSIAKHVFIKHASQMDNQTHFNVVNESEIPIEAAMEMREAFKRNYDPQIKP